MGPARARGAARGYAPGRRRRSAGEQRGRGRGTAPALVGAGPVCWVFLRKLVRKKRPKAQMSTGPFRITIWAHGPYGTWNINI
jgi:hypothetical protein